MNKFSRELFYQKLQRIEADDFRKLLEREKLTKIEITNLCCDIWKYYLKAMDMVCDKIEEVEKSEEYREQATEAARRGLKVAEEASTLLKDLPEMMKAAEQNGFKRAKSNIGKANAARRHAENHAMRNETFAWLDANMPSINSMNKAADQIIRLQPIAWRTAREWVTQWKNLRSASKL